MADNPPSGQFDLDILGPRRAPECDEAKTWRRGELDVLSGPAKLFGVKLAAAAGREYVRSVPHFDHVVGKGADDGAWHQDKFEQPVEFRGAVGRSVEGIAHLV